MSGSGHDVLGSAWVAIQANVADAIKQLDVFAADAEKIRPIIIPTLDTVPAFDELAAFRERADTRPLTLTTRMNTAEARAQLDELTVSEDRAAAGAGRIGAAAERSGHEAKGAFAGMWESVKPLLAIFGAFEAFKGIEHSIKDVREFQTRLVDLQTGAGESAANLGMVSSQLKKMAGDVGVSAIELEKGLYSIESDGYHGAQGLEILRAAAEGARTGMADMETVSVSVMTIMRSYEIPANKAAQATSALVEAVAHGGVRMQDMAMGLKTIAPVAASLNVPLNQIMGAMSTLTSISHNAPVAATGLRYLMMSLAGPANPAAGAMESVNINIQKLQETLHSGGLIPAMQMIEDHLKTKFPHGGAEMLSTLKTIVGGTRGFTAAVELTGPHMKEFIKNTEDIARSTAKAGKDVTGWAAMSHTLGTQLDRTKARMNAWGIEIGSKLLPVLTGISQTINDKVLPAASSLASRGARVAGHIIDGLKSGVRTGNWKGLSSTISDAMGKAFDKVGDEADRLTGDIGRFFGHIKWGKLGKTLAEAAGSALMAMASFSEQLTKAIGKAMEKIDWLGIGVAAGKYLPELVIGLFAGITNLDFGKLLGDAFKHLPEILIGILTVALAPEELLGRVAVMLEKIPLVGGILRWLFEAFTGAAKGIGRLISAPFRAVFRGIGDVIGRDMPNIGGKIVDALWRALHNGLEKLGSVWTAIESGLEAVGRWIGAHGPKQIADGLEAVLRTIRRWAAGGIHWLEGLGSDLLSGLWNGIIKKGWNKLTDGLSRIYNAIWRWASPAIRWLLETGSELLHGLWDGLKAGAHWVLSGLGDVFSTIGRWASGAIRWLYQGGKDIISGLLNGIEDGAKAIWRTVSNIGSDIINGVKHFFGINSPSTVMAELGGHIVSGLVHGIVSTGAGMGSILEDVFGGIISDPFGWAAHHLSEIGGILEKVPGLGTKLAEKAAKGAFHSVEHFLFDDGGQVPPGVSLVLNKTGASEPAAVFTPGQWDTLHAIASGATGGSAGPVDVRVFIGERELTGMIRTEVHGANLSTVRALQRGVKAR